MYQAAAVMCEVCDHKWVAVFPVEADRLECPHCGHMTPTSVAIGLLEPDEDYDDDADAPWRGGAPT